MFQKIRIILSGLLAIFCTLMIYFNNYMGESILVSSSSMFSMLVFILLMILFYSMLIYKKIREYIISFIFSLILAVSTCVGDKFIINKNVDFNNVRFFTKDLYLMIIVLTLIFTAIFVLLLNNLKKINSYFNKILNIKISSKLSTYIKKYFIIILALFFLFCWIPAYLAVFPGNYTYDGPIQISQVFISGRLDQHHPIIHTALLSGFIYLGKLLFGSYDVGLGMYCWFQAIIVAISFAYLCKFMIKNRVPHILVIFSILFLAFNPIIQLFVFITTKDVIFGSLLILCIIQTVEIVKNPEKFYSSNKLMIKYILSIILMCLFRKQGIYVFVIIVPILAFSIRKYLFKTLIISLISILLVEVFLGPIATLMNAKKASSVEMLSVPIQQIARVVNKNPDSLTEDEKAEILSYIPEDALQQYIPEISDPVKDKTRIEEIEKDKMKFIKLWLKIGMKNKGLYIQSFLYGSVGYFYPSVNTSHNWSKVMGAYTSGKVVIVNKPILKGYHDYLYNVGTNLFSDIPIASALVCSALPFWIMIIILSVIIKQKDYKMIIPMLFIAIFWLSLLLGPVYCVRYVYPLLICIPLMISMPFCRYKSIE